MDARFIKLWAKSGKDNHPGGHPVIAHLLDVAASCWTLLEREPASTRELYAQDFGMSAEEVVAFICVLVGLHDIGKVSPAFQQKWHEGKLRLFESDSKFNWEKDEYGPSKSPGVAHGLISQAVIPELFEPYGYTKKPCKVIADAVGCHHGFRAQYSELRTAKNDAERGTGIWDEARAAITDAVFETVSGNVKPTLAVPISSVAQMRLAGLTSFADWIGSSFYPDLSFDSFEENLDDYFDEAKKLANRRLDEIGWTHRLPLATADPDYQSVFAYLTKDATQPFVPRALQSEVQELLREVTAPVLLIIEAPMGEGKTEAAFYAYLRLQQMLEHRGLYVALPTMATGNMMFERTSQFLNAQAEGRYIPLDLQLVHGATQLSTRYQEIQGKIEPDTEAERLDYVAAREFFTHKRRALLSEYGVGTVDQILLSILGIKWHFVRLWGLANRVVVIDEVHAYDTYTSSLIVTLVRWLHALGSSVILMSATLPQKTRTELLAAFGGEDREATSYPRISKVSKGEVELRTFAADEERRITVQLQPGSSDLDEIVKVLDRALEYGGCAACIVNTVDRAQALYQKLAHYKDRYLFHARFPAQERADLEAKVIHLFGKDSKRENGTRPQKAVLVATQVVEQSLDLDFDFMVSDLAPVDLLLQRAGRMWRHKRELSERGVDKPVLYVAGLAHSGELPELTAHYWDKIYQPFALYRSWDVLRGRSAITLPGDIDPLVQAVYSEPAPPILGLSNEAQHQIAADQKAYQKAQALDVKDGENAVVSKFDSKGGLLMRDVVEVSEEDDVDKKRPVALTRKGNNSVTVIPLYKLVHGYFLDAEGLKPYQPTVPIETFKRAVRLSRIDVVGSESTKRYISSPLRKYNEAHGFAKDFEVWKDDALLRRCVPLVLDAVGTLNLERITVRLCNERGIVYEKK